jgi:hypothetical protein
MWVGLAKKLPYPVRDFLNEKTELMISDVRRHLTSKQKNTNANILFLLPKMTISSFVIDILTNTC